MENHSFAEELMKFGLTRQESTIYECLLTEGKITGYEVAKQIGISRSNAYNSLASMTEKGAAYLVVEGNTKKYVPVSLDEFCKNHIRELTAGKQWLLQHMPSEKAYTEGYITIEGSLNILNKMKNLLNKTDERVYIACTRNYLLLFVEELARLGVQNKKIVIVTDQSVSLANAKVYIGEPKKTSIGIISDSKYVITGEYGEGSNNTCLYSDQENLVKLYKKSLANEIELLALKEQRRKGE